MRFPIKQPKFINQKKTTDLQKKAKIMINRNDKIKLSIFKGKNLLHVNVEIIKLYVEKEVIKQPHKKMFN